MNPLILLTLLSLSLAVANESTYTSVSEKDCNLKNTYTLNMGATVACEKYGDIRVQIDDYDARMSITLVRDGILYPQRYSSTVTPHFSALGDKVEWRYSKKNPTKPIAMIARVTASIEGETQHDTKEVSYLAVSKINSDTVCVVGKVTPQKNQNILARKLADKAKDMPCLFNNEYVQVLTDTQMPKTSDETQASFDYVRYMSPLEHALRIVKEPLFPVWRLRLRLFMLNDGYRVEVDRINLSKALYTELSQANGKVNVDQSLDDLTNSDRYTLHYYVIQNNPSYFEEAETQSALTQLDKETCGFQASCTQTWENDVGNWGKGVKTTLYKTPWEKEITLLPAMMRALLKKAGYIIADGQGREEWTVEEIPEGLNDKSPWIEVIIENYAGNGGGYLMELHEIVSDDSIGKSLYRASYDEVNKHVLLYSAVLCARGNNTNNPTQMCQ